MSVPAAATHESPPQDPSLAQGLLPLSLTVLEISLASAPLEEVEEAAVSVTPAWLEKLFAREEALREVALLSTCHRVELLLVGEGSDAVARLSRNLPGRAGAWRCWSDRGAARHLFRVAAGLESLAVGETEVQRQVAAAGRTVRSRHSRPIVQGLIREALSALPVPTVGTAPAPSVAAVAAERLLQLVGLTEPRVLVLGSGTAGRGVARSLAGRARVTLAYHRTPPEPGFLAEVGASAVPLEAAGALFATSDAVVTATKVGRRAIAASELSGSAARLWIDLGVPRNVDPAVRELPGVTLLDVGDLYQGRRPGASRRAEADAVEVDRLADAWSERFERERLEAWVDALRRSVEEVRRSEVASAERFLGALAPEQRLAVERLTRRLVGRLLDPVSGRLRELPVGEDGERLRRLAFELLAPDAPGP